jgi:hypothetical protein
VYTKNIIFFNKSKKWFFFAYKWLKGDSFREQIWFLCGGTIAKLFVCEFCVKGATILVIGGFSFLLIEMHK